MPRGQPIPDDPSVVSLLCWRMRRQNTSELPLSRRDGLPRQGRPPVLAPYVEMTFWASVAEALEASTLQPCDPEEGCCTGDHGIVFTDEQGRKHVRRTPKPERRKEKRR